MSNLKSSETEKRPQNQKIKYPADICNKTLGSRQTSNSEKDSHSLIKLAGRGAMWQLFGGSFQSALHLGASIILARVLFPKDFGMMGMALLFHGLIKRFGDFSAASGVIAKKDPTQNDLSTAFWIEFTIKFLLFVLTFTMAPLAALFFKTPEVTWVIRAVSVANIFGAISAIPSALLHKQLIFSVPKIIETASFTLQTGLSILFAVVYDMNYWALVFSLLIANFVQMAATVIYTRWFPCFCFDKASFRFYLRYGANGLGTSLVNYFQNNTDYFIVGKLLGPSLLGLYEFAYRIPHMALNRFAIPVGRVIFPALSKVQTYDDRLSAGYIKASKNIAFILFPALGGLAAVAEPAVAVLWGSKWLSAIVPLQILCFRSAIQSIVLPVRSIFLCKNRPDIPFKYNLYTLFFTCCVVLGLGIPFGLIGIATGMLISVSPSFIYLGLAFRLTNTPFRLFFTALAPPSVAATFSSFSALFVVHIISSIGCKNIIVLFLSVLAGVIVYILVIWLGYSGTKREIIDTANVIFGRHPVTHPRP